jgi:hypothetical protein
VRAPDTDPVDESQFVLRGRDGWLFLRHDTNDVLGQHEGRVRLDRRRAAAWRQILDGRVALERELGIPWLCVIAPDKEAVYAEHLPSTVSPARRRPVHELLGLAKRAGADLYYPLGDLAASKTTGELYPRTGTHWNDRGAFVAHRVICERLARRGIDVAPLDESRVRWKEREVAQDLGSKLTPPQTSPLVTAELSDAAGGLLADNRIRLHGRVVVYGRRDDDSLPSCLVFGESFAYHLFTFLTELFRRLVFVHSSAVIPEIVVAERPDAVLSLPAERFLIHPTVDRGSMERFRTTVRAKLDADAIYPAVGPFGSLEPGEIPREWLTPAP